MYFGTELRKERERLGVPLTAVAEGTKVQLRQLEALERDTLEELPKGVFRRGMVQSYCRFLGIDESGYLEKLTADEPETSPQEFAEFAEAVKRGRKPEPSLGGTRWAGFVILLLAFTALAYAAWHFVIQPRVGHPAPALPPQAQVRVE